MRFIILDSDTAKATAPYDTMREVLDAGNPIVKPDRETGVTNELPQVVNMLFDIEDPAVPVFLGFVDLDDNIPMHMARANALAASLAALEARVEALENR